MINASDIKKLADLARIEVGEEEASKLAGEIDAILGYVGQVSAFASSSPLNIRGARGVISEVKIDATHNVLREDANPTESETYSKEIIAEFPDEERGYLKVKKIL